MNKKICLHYCKDKRCNMKGFKCMFAKYEKTRKTCKVKGDLNAYSTRKQSKADLKPKEHIYFKEMKAESIIGYL